MKVDKVILGSGTCPFCGKDNTIEVDSSRISEERYEEWTKGNMLAQNAFPKLRAEEKEVLISGICLKCQDFVFADPHDGYEDSDEFEENEVRTPIGDSSDLFDDFEEDEFLWDDDEFPF